MKVTGLFAGIGGLEFGLSQAGHQTLAVAEISRSANAVLAHRIDAPNLGDVTQVRAVPEDTELLTAGFPCQDLSQAGRTAGIGGARSGLIGAVFDILDRQAVPWVLLENVSFMLRLERGEAMKRLVEGFEARGYRWAYRVVNSLAFVPQRRERVFFLASLVGDPADVLFADESTPREAPSHDLSARAHGFYWTEGVRGLGWAVDAVPTLKIGSTVGIPSPPAVVLPDGQVVTPDVRDAERLQGLPVDWTKPAEAVGRASLRWSLVGNAVTAPAAAWIGRRLMDQATHDVSRDEPMIGGWPTAARFDGATRYRVAISSYPVAPKYPPLAEFLRFPGKPLSIRATSGFLSRTERSSLRFPPGFIDSLRVHLESAVAADIRKAA